MKYVPILLWALAAFMPLIFMLGYHYFMEDWGTGYRTGMFCACLVFMGVIFVAGVAVQEMNNNSK